MRIAYLYTALTTIGGVDRIITQKANYLAEKMGYDIYIITDSQKNRPLVFPLSEKVTHIDLEIDFGQQYKHSLLIRGLLYTKLMQVYRRKLKNTLENIKPDIVISTLGREMDFLPQIKDDWILIGESHAVKQFMRNFHLMKNKGGINKIIAQYWQRKQERQIKLLDALIVLTHHDANSWTSIKEAVVIANPLTMYPDKPSFCNENKVISVGRLSREKGHDRLIQTWKSIAQKYPNWTLEIYGEGELREELLQQITNNQLTKQIKLCQPTQQIEEKYRESAFFIMTSHFEAFPLVIEEAMACGLPCIAFDCPYGPREIINDKEDGLLVENGNEEKLYKAIISLIENEEYRKKMGINARNNILRYSGNNIMQQWNDLFKTLTEKQ